MNATTSFQYVAQFLKRISRRQLFSSVIVQNLDLTVPGRTELHLIKGAWKAPSEVWHFVFLLLFGWTFFFGLKCSIFGWWLLMICTYVRRFISMTCFLLTRPCFFQLELVTTPEGWWTCLSSRPLIESFGICWVSTVRDMPSSQTIHAPEKEKWAINFGSWILVRWCCKKRVSGWRCIHLACTLVATTC